VAQSIKYQNNNMSQPVNGRYLIHSGKNTAWIQRDDNNVTQMISVEQLCENQSTYQNSHSWPNNITSTALLIDVQNEEISTTVPQCSSTFSPKTNCNSSHGHNTKIADGIQTLLTSFIFR